MRQVGHLPELYEEARSEKCILRYHFFTWIQEPWKLWIALCGELALEEALDLS